MLRRSSEAQAERKGGNKLGRDDVKHNGPYTFQLRKLKAMAPNPGENKTPTFAQCWCAIDSGHGRPYG